MAEKTRVVVVDDHALLRRGVIRALTLDDMIEVVGEGSSAKDAVDLVAQYVPDLILLDISMPGNGIEAARAIRDLPTVTRVVMLTVSGDEDDVIRALEAGAVGYLLKGTDAVDLITAVQRVKAGESFISPNLALRLLTSNAQVESNSLPMLSEHEKRTLCLISQGQTNREVSEQLAVQERTVRYDVINIFRKLGVGNRTDATSVARQAWRELQSKLKFH
jgi:two-component system, NarL family, nitrate/nitrite response regulator NarL